MLSILKQRTFLLFFLGNIISLIGFGFNLIAVSSMSGGVAKSALNINATRRNAQAVLRSLVDMGLPPSRVMMSAETSANNPGNEVHIYLR